MAHMTQEQIQSLGDAELRSILRSTNGAVASRYWMELQWARNEVQRRNSSRRLQNSAGRAASYTIESLHDGKWTSLGSARSSAGAQIWMRDYQERNPETAYRVVEEPSRRIVVLHDPSSD